MALAPGNPARPRFTVVIVTFDGRRHLERCLPALMATSGDDVELIVVDNGSTDGTPDWLASAYPQVTVIELPKNLGFGEANRRGIMTARADLVALLNNDTVVEPGWLDALAAPLERDPEISASCAVLRLLDHPDILNANGGGMTWLGYGFDRDLGFPFPEAGSLPETADTLFPTAAAALFRKEDFVSSGGFDRAYFMYHEDVDLGWRLWLLGKRVVVCRDAVVRHAWGGTSGASKGRQWRDLLGARHNVRSMIKNFEPWNLARAFKNLLKLWYRARAWGFALRVGIWNLAHLPSSLALRRKIQRLRVRTDADLFGKGLIADAPVPPPTPRIPRFSNYREAAAGWAPNPTLMPGDVSAVERLGSGWYEREAVDGVVAAHTCGRGTCYLRVEPSRLGKVTLTARLPAEVGAATVEVIVNGTIHPAELRSESWRTITVPAQADADGLIAVEFRSPTWVPHQIRHNWDFRRLGCAVRVVRYVGGALREPSPPHTVSVVIPTFNRWECLVQTLEALAVQTRRPDEVIVIDDGSTDGTWERLWAWRTENSDRLPLITLRQPNKGPGQARNLGVAQAHGDLVVFIGDDTFPACDFVQMHLQRHIDAGEACAVVGFTDWDRGGMRVTPFLDFVNRNGEQFAYGLFSDGDELTFNCFYTSNVSIPRTLLGERPFDAAFTGAAWEDAELGYRLTSQGLRIFFLGAARARHHHPMTMRSFLRRQRKVGSSIGTLYRLHPELQSDPVMPPMHPPDWFVAARALMPLLVPILSLLDWAGVPLPHHVYRSVVVWAYYSGRAHEQAFGSRMSGLT
jgi:GT2 family glycosyltransferase